jgi:hypothetical protein
MKVTARKPVAVPRSEAKRQAGPGAAKKPVPAGLEPPKANLAESKLKGERSGDFKALAASGQGLYDVGGREAVDALCARYGIKCKGRGEERMLLGLATLDQALHSSSDIKQMVKSLAAHDARREIFHLEALLRLYSKEHKELEPALARVKALEDVLGDVSIPANAIEALTKMSGPQPVIDALKKTWEQKLEAVNKAVARDWAPGADGLSEGVKKVIKDINKADFGSDGHDRKFVAKALANHVGHIRDEHYSMKVLGDGVHALRRQLRWTTLYAEALDGTVQEGPVKHHDSAYVKVLGHQDLEKLYQMTGFAIAKQGEEPILLPAELYAGLQKSTYELGVIKDDVELRESLEAAYKAAGIPKHRIDDLLGERGTEPDMEKRATVVHEQMKHEHLLKRVHHAFEEG